MATAGRDVPSPAAGCSQTGTPLLPAAATTTMPAAIARRIAASMLSPPPAPTSGTSLPSERLMTSAPCSRAQSMPRATSSVLPPPSSPSTRTGISVAPGATLATPTPLPRRRAEIPLTWVPWPSPSCGVRVALDDVVARPDAAREVGVAGLDARVDDGHDRAGAGGDRVRGVRLDQVEVPLLAAARVRGASAGARGAGPAGASAEIRGMVHRACPARRRATSPLYAITYARMEVGPRSVGSRVRALREAMDLSLRDLAERSGVSAPMLSQVERGETSPTLTVAAASPPGSSSGSPSCCGSTRAARSASCGRGERRCGGADGHRWEVLTPPLPGQRAEVSCHTVAAGRAHGRPRRPADARARRARDEPRPARAA